MSNSFWRRICGDQPSKKKAFWKRSGMANQVEIEKDGRELWRLAQLFLKLGTIAFGGPAAHIAMMRTEVVARRRWMEEQEFLDLVGATNLIPGPILPSLRSTWVGCGPGGKASWWPGHASSFRRR